MNLKHSKSTHKIASILLITAVAVVIITLLAVGISTYIYSVSGNHSNYSDDILASCIVSGNNLAVQIFDSKRADEVVSIEVIIDGYDVSKELSVKTIPKGEKYPKRIIYEDVLIGTSDIILISLTATFNDGSSEIISINNLRVT